MARLLVSEYPLTVKATILDEGVQDVFVRALWFRRWLLARAHERIASNLEPSGMVKNTMPMGTSRWSDHGARVDREGVEGSCVSLKWHTPDRSGTRLSMRPPERSHLTWGECN